VARAASAARRKPALNAGVFTNFGIARPTLGVEADPAGQPQVVGLGDGEVGIDGVHGRDRGEERGIALAHQVPPVHLDLPDDPVDGGLNRRVAEVQLRLAYGGLRGLHRGLSDLDLGPLNELAVPEGRVGGLDVGRGHLLLGQRGIQVLLGNGPGLGERAVPVDVLLRLAQLGLADVHLRTSAIYDGGVPGPREIGLGLGELGARRLERRRVLVALDHEQRLALLDLCALLEQHLLEHAGDPRPHLDGGDRVGARREVADDGNGALHHLGHDDLGRRRWGWCVLLGFLRPVAAECQDEHTQDGRAQPQRSTPEPSRSMIGHCLAPPSGNHRGQ